MQKVFKFISVLSLCSFINSAQTCLNYSTFFGKVGFDEIKGVCSDLQNNIYIVGNTYDPGLPVTVGAFQSVLKGSYEGFISKFDSCGNLIWCTYFGTSGFDNLEKITFSNDNSIVICGHTDGTDLSTTSSCFQSTNNGSNDCFIAKLSLAGAPIWITYFGSTGGDFCYDIKTDSLNNIVIGGTSTSNTLYTTTTSFQQFMAGSTDAFIARFNANGILKFSTFYGGSNSEDIHALTIDKNFNIIGIGGSFSINLNTSAGCFQASSNGGMDTYVLKLDSTGSRIFSTYFGTPGIDDGWGVCTDNSNYIYVSGHSSSPALFTSVGAFQPNKAGANDGYCMSLSPSGTMLWSTYVGGTANDFMTSMHINNNKELVMLLSTQSTDFPIMGVGNTTVNAGGADVAVVKLLTNGTPFWSGYFGGSATEIPHHITSINKNKIAIVGSTASSDLPVYGNSYQNIWAGTEDGFLSIINTESNIFASVNEKNSKLCNNNLNYDLVNDELIIQKNCELKFSYKIYDIMGRLILEKSGADNKIKLNILPSGIYVIHSLNHFSGENSSTKFIKN